jgi:hypothetical protein
MPLILEVLATAAVGPTRRRDSNHSDWSAADRDRPGRLQHFEDRVSSDHSEDPDSRIPQATTPLRRPDPLSARAYDDGFDSADVVRFSPLVSEHINIVGRYHFETAAVSRLRPLANNP